MKTFLLASCLAFVSCAPIAPWQRGAFVRPAMRPVDDPGRAAFAAHIERVREVMVGASRSAGPSCGCN